MTLAAIVIRYTLMTEKFFYDSLDILFLERTRDFYGGSFSVAAKFFHYINFFNINSLIGWSIYLSAIYFFVNLLIIKNIDILFLNKFILLLLSMFLWYLFVVGMTKEILQGLYYLAIYVLCIKNRFTKSITVKIVIGIIILTLSAVCFRDYYILTAFFTIVVYLLLFLIKSISSKKSDCIVMFSVLNVLSLFLFLEVARIAFPHGFEKIVSLRGGQYLDLAESTDSFIGDVIENSSASLMVYVLNYCINFLRLMFPVELLLIGKFYYIPFLLYQAMFSFYYFKSINNLLTLNNEKFISLIFISSFLIVSAMMEPDFGSWARHQSVCWMLLKTLIE